MHTLLYRKNRIIQCSFNIFANDERTENKSLNIGIYIRRKVKLANSQTHKLQMS